MVISISKYFKPTTIVKIYYIDKYFHNDILLKTIHYFISLNLSIIIIQYLFIEQLEDQIKFVFITYFPNFKF